mgnify:CR=1 FL=1
MFDTFILYFRAEIVSLPKTPAPKRARKAALKKEKRSSIAEVIERPST